MILILSTLRSFAMPFFAKAQLSSATRFTYYADVFEESPHQVIATEESPFRYPFHLSWEIVTSTAIWTKICCWKRLKTCWNSWDMEQMLGFHLSWENSEKWNKTLKRLKILLTKKEQNSLEYETNQGLSFKIGKQWKMKQNFKWLNNSWKKEWNKLEYGTQAPFQLIFLKNYGKRNKTCFRWLSIEKKCSLHSHLQSVAWTTWSHFTK